MLKCKICKGCLVRSINQRTAVVNREMMIKMKTGTVESNDLSTSIAE